jgi:hypothetical protein
MPARVGIKLRINRNTPPAEGEQSKDIFGRKFNPNEVTIELSINGEPIQALVQDLCLTFDARDMLPRLGLTIVPQDVDLDIDAEMLALLQVAPTFVFNKPYSVAMAQLPSGTDVSKLVKQYQEAYPGAEVLPPDGEACNGESAEHRDQ